MLRLVLLALLLSLAPASARASTAGEQIRTARALERELRFEEALERWRQAATSASSAREAEVAAGAIARLEARRGPDGFDALRTLERARREPGTGASKVAGIWTAPDTPAPVRLDAGIWLASRAVDQGEHEDALAVTSLLWEAHRGEPAELRVADLHARALVAAGRVDEAAAIEAVVAPPTAPWSQAAQGRLERRRGLLSILSMLGVLAFVGLALAPATRAARMRPLPLPLGVLPVLVLLVGAAAVSQLWSPGLGEPVLQLGLLLAALHALSALALVGEQRPKRRLALRGLAAWGTLGLAFLVLERAGMLGWVKL